MDDLKILENKLKIIESQTLENYVRSKKALIELMTKNYKASGLVITITDLSGKEKFSCCIEDGLTKQIADSLMIKILEQIENKITMLGLK